MLGIYLFQRFLNKLDDYKFENIWQNKILKRQRIYWYLALFYYFAAVGVISKVILFGNEFLFWNIIIIILVLFVYGVYYSRSLLKFVALNNQRFMLLRTGFSDEHFDNNSFNKDNVVG